MLVSHEVRPQTTFFFELFTYGPLFEAGFKLGFFFSFLLIYYFYLPHFWTRAYFHAIFLKNDVVSI